VHRIVDAERWKAHSFGGVSDASVRRLLGPLGARAEEPGRPKTTGYPAVEDVPPRPEKPAMTADELSKLKRELSAARDRHVPKGESSAGKP
jgi:hypothetical protein